MKYQATYLESFHKITQYNFKENISFVFYKKPQEHSLNYVAANSIRSFNLKDLSPEACFLFAPFETQQNPVLALQYDKVLVDEEIIQYADQISTEFGRMNVKKNLSGEVNRLSFMKAVEKIKDKIGEGAFTKVVASRVQNEAAQMNAIASFLQLCDRYDHSFNYLIYIAGECCWIGASPELLLSCKKQHFKTMSLAGTQQAVEGVINYQWGQKELEEQKIVTDYISALLNRSDVSHLSIAEPRSIQAANLIHLISEIEATVDEYQTLIKILVDLHPTPAVCGLPKEEAKAFLSIEEAHERRYYTGFIGLWNGIHDSELFVNLRCAALGEDWISFYAGCGITSGSDAEKEWAETEKKMETLKNVIH
jgi:isochorismate synthase